MHEGTIYSLKPSKISFAHFWYNVKMDNIVFLYNGKALVQLQLRKYYNLAKMINISKVLHKICNNLGPSHMFL